MRFTLVLLLLIACFASFACAQTPVATLTAGAGVTLNGKTLQTAGAPNWPLAAGDKVGTTDKSANIKFVSGAKVKLTSSTEIATAPTSTCTVTVTQGSICYRKPPAGLFTVCGPDGSPLNIQPSKGTVALDTAGRAFVTSGCGTNVPLILGGAAAAATATTVAIVAPSDKSAK